ncbi:hypothetical protein COM13_21385 [Bacillus pseudomycoides]|uniref:Group-specific protein n=1 Tax=Bacillus pseudomycoides TaxID=64104 RepID=A0ABD6SYY8_9BACI|nr:MULTISPECIES: hypothetical protein [Bacillus]AIK40284.1 putative membrane protein [Bacillus pseudomycoides]AJI20060.1 putative membrane protein [Bacillus pseudomycoides]EEM18044.1 hypothetical protein bpmyx0001_10440 [Bacillus pseudomycoides DSM 12442]MBJ8028745.1 hypothetical protein [Bacillus cereus group sp. N21]MCR8856006.1 hypothetical protein [Bacillus pseudomycoides]
MKKTHIFFLLFGICISFFLYILSLLQAFPKMIALPLLFAVIVIGLSYFNHRKRFKGF